MALVFAVVMSVQSLLGAIPTAAAQANAAAISGVAFWDSDLDGQQSLMETVGVPQATVQLLDPDGALLAETSTAEDGSFSFAGLPAGSYTVVILDLLACYRLNSAGSLDVALASGETRDDLRFAFSRNDSWCDDPLLISYAAGSCQDPGLGLRVAGIGLEGATAGTIDLGELPGEEIDAFLLWSGAMDWIIGYGDPDVVFDGQALSADSGYGPQVWHAAPPVYNEDYESWAHRAAVSAGSGPHSLEGVDGFDVYASGAVLFSVYRDDGLGAQQIMIAEGLDQAYGSNGPGLSPGTTRVIFPFEPAATDRQATLVSVVGNVLAGQNSRMWYQTGSGAPPHSIVGTGITVEGLLGSPADMRWDVVETTVTIPVGATWLAVQFESGPAEPLPRLEWVAEALVLPLTDCQTAGNPATLSGTVFLDVNANAVLDDGESGLAGLPVVASDGSGQVIGVATSAADGSFEIAGLAAGTYQVFLDRPAVYFDSTPNPRPVTLGAGQTLPGVDFGLVTTTATTVQDLQARWRGNAVKIGWTTAQESPDATFVVLRATNAGGPFQPVSSEPILGQGVAGSRYLYIDGQVEAGQNYWYQVQALPGGDLVGPVAASGPAHRVFLPLATH